MSNDENLTNYQKAEYDYIHGMKYKEIAEKYCVSVNTVKSWKRRYNWNRNLNTEKGCEVHDIKHKELRDEIMQDLLKQLADNDIYGKHYEDLVSDYMEMWDIKNDLISDIKERGVAIPWSNGKQEGIKKNDSISELNKTNAQMLKILSELGLKPVPQADDDDDI